MQKYKLPEVQIYGAGIAQALDGGLVFVGRYETGSYQLDQGCFAKTDSFGNLEFHRGFGGPGNDSLKLVVPTADSGFLLAGLGSLETSEKRAQIIKIDSEGEINSAYTLI